MQRDETEDGGDYAKCDACGSPNIAGPIWTGIRLCWDCRAEWHRASLPIIQKWDDGKAQALKDFAPKWAAEKKKARAA